MDETELKYAEEELREQQAAQNIRNAGQTIDSLSSGLADTIESRKEKSNREKDKDSINSSKRNESNHSSRFGGNKKDKDDDDDDNSSGKKKSDLGDKDGLDDKDKDKDSKDKSKDDGGKKNKGKNVDLPESGGDGNPGFIEAKWNRFVTKIKIYLIAAAVVLAFFVIAIFIAVIDHALNSIYGSISADFGVSEADTKEGLSESEADGLMTSEEYLINPQTGEQFSTEELVEYLKNDEVCRTTTMSKIIDWFDSLDGKMKDYCGYYRYINKRIEELEDYYSTELDRGLIITSLYYGFANQEAYYDYKEGVNLENVDDIQDANKHYESLESIINEGDVLNIDNVTADIDNSVLVETGPRLNEKLKGEDAVSAYYVWNVELEAPYDGADEDEYIAVGYCTQVDFPMNAHYSSFKWSIMLRFGEEASETYENELRYTHKYDSTSDECKLGMSDAELLEIVRASSPSGKAKLDGSVRKKNDYFVEKGKPKDLSPFEQKANTETSTADVFTPFGDMELNYRNGFAYENFPAFSKSIEGNPDIELSYDYITTPKQIEEIIQNVIIKKKDSNYYLSYKDLDSNEYSMLGDFVIGASCQAYLTAAPDAIQVKLNDCDGHYIKTTTFKDYIMGVAYGEVSDSGDNYVMSEMVAAITYSLHRRSNYLKGTTITMRSGNCDQVYCSMTEGCYKKTSSISCGSNNCISIYPGSGSWHGKASTKLQEKYANYYETAKDYLLVSNDKPHAVSYRDVTQNRWKEKSDKGIPFTQIVQEEYSDEGAQLIKCNGQNDTTDESTDIGGDDTPTSRIGNTTTSYYNQVAPDRGKFYGFSYNDEPEGRNITMNPEWIKANIVSMNSNCPSGGWSKSYKINKYAQSNFKAAYSKICTILTSGVRLSDGSTCKLSATDLGDGGTFVQRKTSSGGFSLHAYGIAQDWNYSSRYYVNGKEYRPYHSQGASTKAEYDRFVQALGKEEDCRNVNYILWKYAFKPSGFNWGGNWGVNSWDGMHFEVNY